MTYQQAKEKLISMGGNCISWMEQVNSGHITIMLHHPALGVCASGNNFETAFADLQFMLDHPNGTAEEQCPQEVLF